MKLSKLDFHEGLSGLRAFTMDRLGDVVVLAGPNGGGKTRILTHVGKFTKHGPNDYWSMGRELASMRAMRSTGGSPGSPEPRLTQLETQLKAFAKPTWDLLEGEAHIVTIDVGSVSKLDAPATQFGASSSQSVEPTNPVLNAGELRSAITRIHNLLMRNALAESPKTVSAPEKREQYQARVARLNDLTVAMLGTKFEIDPANGSTLFGLALEESELSRGQLVLLGVLVALFDQKTDGDGLIFVWDEPELHLHPAAVVDVLDRLRSAFPRAQLWLATHSIHLLSHFDETSVWYVQDGKAERAGRNSEAVAASLVGGVAGLENLHQFLRLPAQRAFDGFCAQCLLPAGVADSTANDPQTTETFTLITGDRKSPVRVLDFGAGKARLLTHITSVAVAAGCPVSDYVDYWAFNTPDITVLNRKLVDDALVYAYGKDGPLRHVVGDSVQQIKDSVERFDYIVMCNVLHEIDVEHWQGLFGPDGMLPACLKDDGELLIVEDYKLSAGERAHRHGFLLLDAEELRVLFKAGPDEVITKAHSDHKFLDRLRTHQVKRDALFRVDAQSAHDAIDKLGGRSFEVARGLHGLLHTPAMAKEFALATFGFINAKLALEWVRENLLPSA